METYISPSVSSYPCSQDLNFNNMMSSLRNLNLSSGNQERNNDHGGIYASHYSRFSPKPQCFDQGSSFRGPQLVDRASRGSQSHGGMRINIGPGYSRMYNGADRIPVMSMPVNASFAYGPSYIGCGTLNQNGYFGQGFTQTSSNGQNGYHNQEFTETRGNGQNGYDNQEFTERTNRQGLVSMTMRNVQFMFFQNAVGVELVRCKRILNEILRRSLPQLEAKMAVHGDGQQSTNRISENAQGSPGPTISTRIFVGGLASTVTESDLKTYFDQFGTITNAEVKYDHFTQRARGFGFITFDSEKAVDKVLLRTSFHELNGKMVEVKRAFPKDLYRKSIRGQLGGLNYGLRKVSNLLGDYTQAYGPSQVGGSGNA